MEDLDRITLNETSNDVIDERVNKHDQHLFGMNRSKDIEANAILASTSNSRTDHEVKCNEGSSMYNKMLASCCCWFTVINCFKELSISDLFSSVMYIVDVGSDVLSTIKLFQGEVINKTMFENVNFTAYNKKLVIM